MKRLRNMYFAWRLRNAIQSQNIDEALKVGRMETELLNGPVDEMCHSALTLSVSQRNVRAVRLVMSMGTNPNLAVNVATGLSALHYLAQEPYDDKGRQIFDEIMACRVDKVNLDIEAVQSLYEGVIAETPMMRAIRCDNIEFVRQLITSGADVNYIEPLMGATPMLIASGEADHEIMELLLQKGASAKQASTGQFGTLHWLCANGRDYPECVELLCNAGAVVDQLSLKTQQTPLMLAAYNGLYHCVEALLKYGADPGKRDHLGRTPISHARMNDDDETAEKIIRVLSKKR